MISDQTRKRITELLQATITSQSITTPCEWPNQTFKKPAGAWMRISILPGESILASIGGASQQRTRTTIILAAQVFLPADSGTIAAYQLKDKLAAMDNTNDYSTSGGKTLSLKFRSWSMTYIGKTNDGSHQYNLTMPIVADGQLA